MKNNKVKAKLISSTNNYMNDVYKNIDGEIFYKDVVYWESLNTREQFRTSLILSSEYNKEMNEQKFETCNSIYIFKVEEELKIEITNDNKKLAKEIIINNSKKYKKYYCQIMGNPFIDGAIDIVEFDKPKNKKEAIKYIEKTICKTKGGDLVRNILIGKSD